MCWTLRQVAFKNFKALADVEVSLSRFTVLVGPNACGKTTVLRGVDLLGTMWGPASPAAEWVSDWCQNSQSEWRSDPGIVNVELSARDSDAHSVELLLAPQEVVIVEVDAEHRTRNRFVYKQGQSSPDLPSRAAPGGPRLVTSFMRIYSELASLPSYSEEFEPTLGFGGQNLPLVLANFAADRPEVLEQIRRDLQKIVPQVHDLRMPRRRVEAEISGPPQQYGGLNLGPGPRTREKREVMGNGLQLVLDDGRIIEAEDASEGTIRALAILTAIHSMGKAKKRVALIDDLDQALHPSAQLELVRVLRRLLEIQPELQIMATTHSPYLLDAFDEDEVRVMNRDANGRTVCRPLAEHPEWPKWRGKLQLGEFWSSTGEDWLVEPHASAS